MMTSGNLDKNRRKVLEESKTEYPGTGKLLRNKQAGEYMCGKCGQTLFLSDHKYDSNSGWPSFYDLASQDAVSLKFDDSHGMARTEAVCSSCGGHLGHVFDDAFGKPGGQRYCVNSASLDFKDKNGNITNG